MSTLEEVRQNQRERQRRDCTGERLKEHDDARDVVSGKKHLCSANGSVHVNRGFVKNY